MVLPAAAGDFQANPLFAGVLTLGQIPRATAVRLQSKKRRRGGGAREAEPCPGPGGLRPSKFRSRRCQGMPGSVSQGKV